MKAAKDIYFNIKEFLSISLFKLGGSDITLWTIVYLILLLFLLFFITAKLKRWIVYKLLEKSKIELGVRIALGTFVRYIILALGFIIILQTVGINLNSLTILAGALGVGIGFGLQNITNNFVSGIIILLERPIKVGDRVQVGEILGDVVNISMRSTTVVTNDNIAVIVPNSDFISSQVINWSFTDRNVRMNIPVGVSYNSEPEQVKKILLEVAEDDPAVLKTPKPDVIFDSFGDSSLNFILRVWSQQLSNKLFILKSQLYFEIFKRFKDAGIEIPFPQRDLHIKNTEFKIQSS
jgi:small-conductance mechanosensitive channel